jgi:Tol biopolymer transport system component
LTEGSNNNFLPAWNMDGSQVFFISNRSGSNQIWKIFADGGEALQITKQGGFEMYAAPDGKTIVYSKGSGKLGLWQVNIDGKDEKPIPELSEIGAWRSWTATTNGVYYPAFSTQPPFHLKFFDFATRQTKEITTVEKSPLSYYSNLSVSQDGKRILYAQLDRNASAILLAELK